MLADFNTLIRLESDIIEKRLSSSARERSGLPASGNARPHQRTHRIYKAEQGTGITQDIPLQTQEPPISTVLIAANPASIHDEIETDPTPELDPRISRLWALYQTAKVEYSSCQKGSFAHSKAARFLRDTIENGLTYIERAYPSVVCDGNSETLQGANLLGVQNKMVELRTCLNEVTPVVEKAYGGQRRRFGSELFQPTAHAAEDKQRVSLHHRNPDMNVNMANGSHRVAYRDAVSRDTKAISETIRASGCSRSPPHPRLLARPRARSRSRSRSPPSSRFPLRMRSPLSSPGPYNYGYAANRNIRKFRLDGGSWRAGLTPRHTSFPQEKDRYRPTY